LAREGLSRLKNLDPKPPVRRYQRDRPGELIHIDIKKLGRIKGIGHRITGDPSKRCRGIGWEFVHVAIDVLPGWPMPRSWPTKDPQPQAPS
jgi:hypothetical protein